MRSYGQYCALAKALDVVGERWTLLIVRELLLRPACRFTDIRDGLPGIASNLLTDRLRDLEDAGIIRRDAAPPPVATNLYSLTDRGRELKAVVEALGCWGGVLLSRPARNDAFQTHWLALPINLHLRDRTPNRPPITIQLHTGDEPMWLETVHGTVRVRLGTAAQANAVISGPPGAVIGLLLGKFDVRKASDHGVRYDGDTKALARVQPSTHP